MRKKIFLKEEEDRSKEKWVSCRWVGEARRRARRRLCPFLFLPDSGLFLSEPSVAVKVEDWTSQELMLLILCVILGTLLLGSVVTITVILLKIKRKYGKCRVHGATGKAQGREEAAPTYNPPRGV